MKALILALILVGNVDAFGFSGRTDLIFNSTGYCVGDSWKAEVTTYGLPDIELSLRGKSNDSAWEVPRWGTTDANGRFSTTGVFASDAVGRHTIWVETDYGAVTESVSFTVVRCDVYVMSGGNPASDRALLSALTARGHTPKLGVEAWRWDGTQIKLNNFSVVVLVDWDWMSPDMPAAGQNALLDYVSKGGGLVTGEWLIWSIASELERGKTISPMIPAVGGLYGGASSATYTQAKEDLMINKGLPRSFSFALNNLDGSESFLQPKAGATSFYSGGNSLYGGLIGWNYLYGRVISFSTFISEIELADSNYARLFVNAVEWAASGQGQQIDFAIKDRGGMSWRSAGTLGAVAVGYAAIQPGIGFAAPSGLAIFGLRQNNVLVSEATAPASPLIQSGRIYAEVKGPVNTGLAMANPNDEPAAVSFFFTDATGDFGHASTTIPAKGQIAAFLNQAPFNGPSLLNGALTFNSSVPVAVLAMRGLTNERSEFLASVMTVIDINVPPAQGTLVFPHFVESGGWTTELVLVNPTDSDLSGMVEFRDQLGQVAPVIVKGQPPRPLPSSIVSYFVPARSSQKLQTASGTSFQSGSVRVFPATGSTAPAGVAVFSLRNEGITVAETGAPATSAGFAFRLYVETAGDFDHGAIGSIQTGLAVSNNSASPANVVLELTTLDGSSAGLTGTLSIPGDGQAALFLRQIPGFESLPAEFRGILRVSSAASLSVVGLRGRYNERSDFLLTSTPPVNEAPSPSTGPLYFPHIVDSGGYTTQFILFPGQPGSAASGKIRLFSQTGGELNLGLQ